MATGWCVLHLVRALDRALPPRGLRVVLWPVGALLATRDWFFRKQAPGFPTASAHSEFQTGGISWWQAQVAYHLVRLLSFLPDRFAETRWRSRCRIVGLSAEEMTKLTEHPVVLATLHFGPISLLRYWLRVFGFKAAILVDEPRGERNAVKREKDRLNDAGTGITGVPHVYTRGELRQALRALESGHALTITADHLVGKVVEVAVEGTQMRLAAGAMRLAESNDAWLVPCLLAETGPWEFTLHLGRPMKVDDVPAAARHLLAEFLPVLRAHPGQCSEELLRCLSLETPAVARVASVGKLAEDLT